MVIGQHYNNLRKRFMKLSRLAFSQATSARKNKTVQIILLAVGITIFVVGLTLAVMSLPSNFAVKQWNFILLSIFIGAPLLLLLSAVDAEISSRLIGFKLGFGRSIQISFYGAAASVFPLPGTAIARFIAFKNLGASNLVSGSVVVSGGVLRAGVAFLYAFPWIYFVVEDKIVGIACALIALVLISFAIGALRYFHCSFVKIALLAIAKLLTTLIGIINIYWLFLAYDIRLDISELSVFIILPVIRSGINIIPAGIGVAEFLAAAISSLVDLPASVGFVVAVTSRITNLFFIVAVMAAIFLKKVLGSIASTS